MWKAMTFIPAGIGWLLAAAALALPAASAEEANKKGKDALVRAIDLKGFRRDKTSGVALKPTKITNAEELAKAFPDTDKNWRDQIARQVDFEKEELLFFAWTGSNTDRLSFKVEETRKGPSWFSATRKAAAMTSQGPDSVCTPSPRIGAS